MFVLGCVTPNKVEEINKPISHEPKWFDSMTIYEVNVRQYTPDGTFAAFREHLPRLKNLGVEILWFMPIHPISELNRKGSLGSYYSISDYRGINPEFGTLDEFKELVNECHSMGMRVILDWVPNHTGWDNAWITDNPEWYTQEGGNIIHPKGTDWTDVADLNYNNMEMRSEMVASMKFWVEEVDVDGFRCDVAGSVPLDFWEDASKELNDIKPLFMLAEDGFNYSLLKNAFDSNYNWNFLHLIGDASHGRLSKASIKDNIRNCILRYTDGTFPMNFVTNHDENSWNGTAYERLGDYKDMLTALTFFMPGMPLIYSGQEAGLNKRLLFFEKDEIDWSDLSQQKMLQELISMKKTNPALHNGTAGGKVQFINSTERDILIFARIKDNNRVLFMANMSGNSSEFDLRQFGVPGSYRDIHSEKEIKLTPGTQITLDTYEYKIFVSVD